MCPLDEMSKACCTGDSDTPVTDGSVATLPFARDCGRRRRRTRHRLTSPPRRLHSAHCAECNRIGAVAWLDRAREICLPQCCDMSHSQAPTTAAEQSHYLEVMLRARIWPPVARHACRHHRAHLSCAWQPSALPPSFAPPSLHVLGSMSESCVPAAEDDVCRRDVSPYGCEDVISCLSTRQSRQRRSLTPYSARV